MAWRVVQEGRGEARPLVVIYHATGGSEQKPTFVDDRVKAACGPSTKIVNYTAPVDPVTISTGGAYNAIGAVALDGVSRMLSWPEIEVKYAKDFLITKRVASAFSGGCTALRTQLAAGAPLDGVLAIDGVHGDKPIPEPWQAIPWGVFGADAALGIDGRQLIYTCTQIDPVQNTLPDRVMIDWITGMGPFEPGPSPDDPKLYRRGDLLVYSYPGNDGAAHSRQVQVALPRHLNEILVRLGVLDAQGPEAIALRGLLPSAAGAASAPSPALPLALGAAAVAALLWRKARRS